MYEIIGALESTALLQAFDRIKDADVKKMERLNAEMKEAIEGGEFDLYYEKNLVFHDTFLCLGGNDNLVKIVHTLKKRLYDFPRRQGWVKEWETGLDRRARRTCPPHPRARPERGLGSYPGRPLVLQSPGKVHREILSQGRPSHRWLTPPGGRSNPVRLPFGNVSLIFIVR